MNNNNNMSPFVLSFLFFSLPLFSRRGWNNRKDNNIVVQKVADCYSTQKKYDKNQFTTLVSKGKKPYGTTNSLFISLFSPLIKKEGMKKKIELINRFKQNF